MSDNKPIEKAGDNKKTLLIVLVLAGVGILCVVCAFVAVVLGLAVSKVETESNDATVTLDANVNLDTGDSFDSLFGDSDDNDDNFFDDYDVNILEEGKEGDTLQIDDQEVTLESVLLGYETDDLFIQASEGYQLLVVEVKVENKGNDEVTSNPFDFSLFDSNEESYTYKIFGVEPLLSVEELGKGDSSSGYLTFEVPNDESEFRLRFETSFFAEEAVEFII